MSWLITLMRRMLWLALLAAVGGAIFSWWRGRTQPPTPTQPQWPPLSPDAPVGSTTTRSSSTTTSTPADPVPAADDAATTSVVNELVDAPDARSNGGASWVEPNADGSCPVSHPIKANDNSGIFHVPGGRFYDRTGAERCYRTAEGATDDGYRRAKS